MGPKSKIQNPKYRSFLSPSMRPIGTRKRDEKHFVLTRDECSDAGELAKAAKADLTGIKGIKGICQNRYRGMGVTGCRWKIKVMPPVASHMFFPVTLTHRYAGAFFEPSPSSHSSLFNLTLLKKFVVCLDSGSSPGMTILR